MEKVQIIPTPKDVDSRILTWKGAAVLGKMDGVSDLWITPEDWVRTSAPCRRWETDTHVVRTFRPGNSWDARFEGALFLSLNLYLIAMLPAEYYMGGSQH